MKIRFIAIGGSVMHQLAIALKKKGNDVSGSDDEIFEPAITQLEQHGLMPPQLGWFPALLDENTDAVILGMHAKADNPELLRAKELQIPVYSFPEYIYHESQQKTRVVIGGSHGKTTTTAMIMHVLRLCHRHFDYLVGARLEGFTQSVHISDAPVIVCEGDEYPASAVERRPKFHFLFPHVAVITGIAWDHINVFPTFDNYLEQFKIFIQKIETGGHLIYNKTDEVLTQLVEQERRSDLHYHLYGLPSHRIEDGKTIVTIGHKEAPLQVFGNHNLMNLQAARLVCGFLGVPDKDFADAIASFRGAAKRLELLASGAGAVFFRDFAHAPSKVKATIHAVRNQYPDRKMIIALELHTYSSLNADFMSEYRGALNDADHAAVFYSNHALELKRLPALSPELVQQGFGKPDLQVINERNKLEEWLDALDYAHAVTVFMSSGNYDGFDAEAFAQKKSTNQP